MQRSRKYIKKTIQAVGVLLRAHGTTRLEYLRVLKLLYIADRRLLAKYGESLTGDRYVAMKRGPVLSHTYNLIQADRLIQNGREQYLDTDALRLWSEFFDTDEHELVQKAEPGRGSLSDLEVEMLRSITTEFESMTRWDIVKLTHYFPEWRRNYVDGVTTSAPIPISTILSTQDSTVTPEEVERRQHLADRLEELFGNA